MADRTAFTVEDLVTPESVCRNPLPKMLVLACSEKPSDVRASAVEAQAVLDGVADAVSVFADYLRVADRNNGAVDYQVANGLTVLSGVIAMCQAAFNAAHVVGMEADEKSEEVRHG